MAALAGFSACRPEDKPPVDSDHTHTFNTEEWKHDGNYHWHPATCEHTNEQGDRAAHVYTETVKTEATCTEGAVVLYKCSCGYSYEETTNALGHDLHTVEAKAPSCEEDGYGEYQKCSRCDYKEGYKVFLKTGKHIYSTTKWEHDAISHWRPAICGCDRKSEEALHTFGEDGKCVCGFEIVSNDAEIEATFLLEEVKKDDVVVGYVITGLTDAGKAKEVLEFPTYYKGNAVTSISARAFEDNATVTEIKLSETITVIGREAFNNCTKLAKITFANRLEKIEESAFGGCEALTAAELPQTVTSLGAYAFDGCTALKTVSLPKSLTTLGDQAFGGCSSLEKIDIPASIGKINDNMFLNCSALSEVVLHEGTTSIGRQAFARCAALESVTLPRGLTFIGQSAFRGSGLKEIELPSSVTTLASYAFAECDALAKATLSSSLTFSFGGWFAGSKALAEITIPFVGSEIAPDTAVSKAFGYIFTDREPATDKDAYVAAEEYGKTYYIPVALKKVTVLKGTVSAGAFDGCSQLEEIAVKGSVTLVSGTFENCTAKITWIGGEPMPELSDVTLSSENAEVGEEITLTYVASATCTVTVSVKKGEDAAAETDYTYDAETKKIVFNAVGSYTVTVEAKLGDNTVSKTATVTIVLAKPVLSDLDVSEKGDVDTAIDLGYTVDGESVVTVSVKKGAADVAEADYTFDAENKQITFKKPGDYTVTVIATRNEMTAEKSAQIRIVDPNAPKPEITLTAAESTVTEGAAVALTASVVYAEGTEKEEEGFTVTVKQGETYVAADASAYELAVTGNKSFKPLVAGEYKITFTASNTQGGFSEKTVEITAEIADITLAWNPELTLTNGWYRVASGATGAELALNITGYAANYTVAVTKNGTADATLLADGKLTVQSDEPDTAEYAITYTHNADGTIVKKLSVKVSFVSDLVNAPALGEDPFNGTYGKLIPGAGLLLYSDVSEGATVTFTATDATVETMDNVGTYVYVANADNAKIFVKLTAEKDGATAAATKVFDVIALGGDVTIDSYTRAIWGADSMKNVQTIAADTADVKILERMIVSKTGIVHNRQGDKSFNNVNFANIVINETGADVRNFQIDFTVTVLHGASICLKFCPHDTNNNWLGNIDLKTAGSGVDSWGWMNDRANEKGQEIEGGVPSTAKDTVIHARLSRIEVSGKAVWTMSWQKEDGTYLRLYSCETPMKDISKILIQVAENNGFYLENVTVSAGPATPEVTLGGNADIETPVTLGYTVTEGATATVSFQKDGGAAVENTDYTYNTDTKAIHFLTGGTYTVTVTATLNGVTVSTEKTVTVTVPEPELSDVTVNDADGAITDGVINTGYTLTYTKDGVSTVAVTVKKGENEAEENTDYTLADGTITFVTPGVYTVTVKATRNGIDATKSVTVNIEDPALVKPDITFTVGEDNTAEGTVEEGSAIALAVTVDYHDATKQSEAYAVTVERSGSFVTADAELYELSTDGASKSFTPKVAGKYRITLTATTTAGAFRTATVEVTATIVELTFAITETGLTVQNGSVLVTANSDAPASVEIPYALTGYTGGYELTVSKDDNITWNTETENQLTASYQGENAGGYTFTYKHKSDLADKGLWKVFSVKVSFVADTANAITFGADPFGGTHGRLIPSTGLVLYHEAYDKNGDALTYADITYEIVSRDVKINGTEALADSSIYISTSYEHGTQTWSDYPYLMVENFENNTATGTIVVKLTATKDGATAVATKEFEVRPLEGETNSASGTGLSDYISTVAGDAGDIANYDAGMSFGNRQNCVIGKNGVILDRAWAGGNVARVDVNGSDNFQVDFSLIPMTKDEKISFAWKFVTGSASDNGETGHSALYYESDNTKFDAGCWSFADGDSKDWGDTMLDVTLGAKYYIRIIHTVVDGKVQITYQGSTDQVNYGTFFSATRNTSTTKGDLGSPVYGLTFYRENDLGQMIVGNFNLTYLD